MEKREHPLSRKTDVISGKRTNCRENVWINEECKQTPRETRQRRNLLCRKINIFYVGKCAIIQKFCDAFAHQGGAVKIYSGMHIYGETIKTGEGI